ncbi:MAG: hypothetical protein U0790_24425, partial [Isosphaeraceae bacterium]
MRPHRPTAVRLVEDDRDAGVIFCEVDRRSKNAAVPPETGLEDGVESRLVAPDRELAPDDDDGLGGVAG